MPRASLAIVRSAFLSFPEPLEKKADVRVRSSFRQDILLVRMYRELSRRLEKEGVQGGFKARTISWGGAWEVEKALLEELVK